MKNGNIWKWVAGALLAFVLGYAGNAIAETYDLRERVAKLEQGFQYVIDTLRHIDEHFHKGEEPQ